MALYEKVYGVRIPVSPRIFAVHGVFDHHPKIRKPLRRNQKLATSEDLSCSCNLSAIRAMNSELVGLPLVLLTVYPKKRCKVSKSPLSQATSMACRMARSTLLGVVWKVFATWGYSTFVMAFVSLTGHGGASQSQQFVGELIGFLVAHFTIGSLGLL